MTTPKQVLVVGMGISGLAMARWCARAGDHVTLIDTREDAARLAQVQSELPAVTVKQGPLAHVLGADAAWSAIYVSPGLSPAHLSPVTAWSEAQGCLVGTELDLFVEGLKAHEPAPELPPEMGEETPAAEPDEADDDLDPVAMAVDGELASDETLPPMALIAPKSRAPQVLAITGTNGKTTVTALTRHLLRWSGIHAVVAGNIGTAMLDALMSCLDNGEWPDVWVLELSSFQLAGSQSFEPTAATILNISQDHLDWHGDMAHYVASKQRIFGELTLRVLNRQDQIVMASEPPLPPTLKRGEAPKPYAQWQSFGADAPTRPGDWGLESTNGLTWLVRAEAADDVIRQPKKEAPPVAVFLQRLMPADALRIRGQHNACNALAALALATAAGGNLALMLHALREYPGEPHRVQPVAILQDVEYIDDSKGTNVGATLAALNGLGVERPLVVILGGDGKGQDFAPLCEPIKRYARAVVLIGKDAGLIRQALSGTGVDCMDAVDMSAAVQAAAQVARTGDVVLLSPACASLDMYKNYVARAAAFTDAVQALADQQGAVLS
ncbi:MAG: UDP-N-acetylmuramoyl-L-alanine--D-glutamate ligase [Burkholderiaceae bacterium]|nr:UDP-N-acetylmuramoyl-L-alanine--D-glutamate ligase [Burkholderiaceae bacterium]